MQSWMWHIMHAKNNTHLYCSTGYIFWVIKELLYIDSRDDIGGRVRCVLFKRVKQTHSLVLKLEVAYNSKHTHSTQMINYKHSLDIRTCTCTLVVVLCL